MADKQITDLTETTNSADDDELIIQKASSGNTFKSKLVNLLKNVFTVRDVYDDYLISGLAVEAAGGGLKPTFANFRDNLYLWEFPNAGVSAVYFTLHLTHTLKAGTDMTFHVHWTHNQAAPSGNVKWNIEYSIAKGYGTSQYAATTTLSSVQTGGAQYTHHITNDDDMTITTSADVEPDAIIVGRLFRDGDDVEDTFNNGIFLLHVDVHYVKSRVGTTERNRPFTSGGFAA